MFALDLNRGLIHETQNVLMPAKGRREYVLKSVGLLEMSLAAVF